MTLEGYRAIERELKRLWHEERPMVVDQVSKAAELGDRSENAEYIYGKKRLRQIDSRMRFLRGRIEGVSVIDTASQPQSDIVRFGAIVVLDDGEGRVRTWRLVDKDESDVDRGRISVQSPVGKALIGKREGDEVEVRTPSGVIYYEITEVRYGPGEP